MVTKKKRKPKVIYTLPQTGKRASVPLDRKKIALKPGKRKSKTNKTYWETRKNRSDKAKSNL